MNTLENQKKPFLYNPRVFLLIIVFVCLNIISFAQNERRHITIENLKQNWLVFSEQNNQFLPYIRDIHSPVFIHFYLNLNKYKEYHLLIEIPNNTSLFIENKLVEFYKNSQTINLRIDSLQTAYELDNIFITIFSEENISETLQTYIVDFNLPKDNYISKMEVSFPLRIQNRFQDFKLISILFIVLTGIIIRLSQEMLYKEYFSMRKIFTLNPRSEILYSISFFSKSNLLFLMFYGIIIGFSISNVVAWVTLQKPMIFSFSNTVEGIIFAIVISILVIFIMILKYLILKLIANIFMFRKVTSIHNYEYLRFSFIISLILFVLTLVNNFSKGTFANDYIIQLGWLLGVLAVFRSIFIYFKLNKLFSFRKLHLFSYLCSTEIIPLIIFLKIFSIYFHKGVF